MRQERQRPKICFFQICAPLLKNSCYCELNNGKMTQEQPFFSHSAIYIFYSPQGDRGLKVKVRLM